MRTTTLLTTERTLLEVGVFALFRDQFCSYGVIQKAIACEVLARRIVHLTEPDKIATVMSKRYRHRQIDGDASEMSSALEVAIDQHW